MVSIPAVLDSTCLIGLDNIGHLDLAEALLSPAFLPPEVTREVGIVIPWTTVVAPSDKALVASLQLMVDAGEAEAIALALEKRVRVILDDRKARSVASRLGVPVTGTVGLLLKAKQTGLVTAIKPLLAALNSNQFHISRELIAEALRLAGE